MAFSARGLSRGLLDFNVVGISGYLSTPRVWQPVRPNPNPNA
jgi:hypothetical protein